MTRPIVYDQFGGELKRDVLTQEVAAPRLASARSPISGYPADGLDPVRLALYLRAADQGDPVRFLELAEAIEERDPHYTSILGTRKRSVCQLEITVEPGDDSSVAEHHAQMVRDWLKRDELTEELFDIMDAIGKGYSFTEIIWDLSARQYMPTRLKWRDPRWFRFARHDLETPLMLNDTGAEVPLYDFKFINARIQAKSGLPLRSGIARVACWTWMFKAFTQRDWSIFTQTYGQPLRVGKYTDNASKEDQDTLFNAVANIAGDCAAIIPNGMQIDFVEAKNVGSSTEHYERRSDWLDRQNSKLVLGQTTTTDAVSGGHAVSKEHREVQGDIEKADARALSAIINRDLIRPWIMLEHGPQKVYPRLVIARPEAEDLEAFSRAVTPLIGVGLRVSQSEVLGKFGLKEPAPDEPVLAKSEGVRPVHPALPDAIGAESEFKGSLKKGFGREGVVGAAQAKSPSEGRSEPQARAAEIADQLGAEAQEVMTGLLSQIETMFEDASSLPELKGKLVDAFPQLDTSDLRELLTLALVTAEAEGQIDVAQGDD